MKVKVYLWNIMIGELGWDKTTARATFAFSEEYMDSPFDISPTLYPKQSKQKAMFYGSRATQGLPEFLADSLPDDWGNKLFDQWSTRHSLPLNDSRVLAKLSFIGKRAMGAFEFIPEYDTTADENETIAINELYEQAMNVLYDRERAAITAEEEKSLSKLIMLGTSVGGKHAKGIIAMDEHGNIHSGQVPLPEGYRYFILKFNEDTEVPTAEIEKIYYDMATECGIEMMYSDIYRTSDSPDAVCHFLTERFDRLSGGVKLHTQTLKAMSPVAHDYMNLFWLIERLDVPGEKKELLFRQMVFNYFAGVSDDHSKNFSFIMDRNGKWNLSPAYDLTFTSNIWKEPSAYAHCLGVWGKNSYLTAEDFIDFGEDIGIGNAQVIIDDIASVINTFPEKAAAYGIDKEWKDKIWKVITSLLPDKKTNEVTNNLQTDIEYRLRQKYNSKTLEITGRETLTTNGKTTGELIHLTVNGKKRTCVTDNETQDICISPGHIKKGEFHLGTWKTIDGKTAAYTGTRVMSAKNRQKLNSKNL